MRKERGGGGRLGTAGGQEQGKGKESSAEAAADMPGEYDTFTKGESTLQYLQHVS